MIQIDHLSKSYGTEQVLHDIHVVFRGGTIYGLTGANGCGKTTLMRCICGFARPTCGSVTVKGKRIGKEVDFAPDTGMILEAPGFLPHDSGFRNLWILSSISGGVDQARVHAVMRQVGLDPTDPKPVGKYSLGMRQRLGIAQAMMEDPDILLLDEPFNGLDKDAIAGMRALFEQLKADGKLIILISHYAQEIADNCDIVYEMVNGSLRLDFNRHSPVSLPHRT